MSGQRTEIEAFLADPENRRVYRQEVLILQVTNLIHGAMCGAGVTRTELASRLGVSKPAVTQMLDGQNMTLRTVADVFGAMGLDVEITVRRGGGAR